MTTDMPRPAEIIVDARKRINILAGGRMKASWIMRSNIKMEHLDFSKLNGELAWYY